MSRSGADLLEDRRSGSCVSGCVDAKGVSEVTFEVLLIDDGSSLVPHDNVVDIHRVFIRVD